MHTKKTRIISFLMAFLLIFTFAFLNPLTVSQSQAALPALVLSANGVKIIAGVLASAGIGIVAGQALQEVDFSSAVESLSYVVYRTLNGAQKLALMTLSVVDNIVEVPISLYNAIVNNAKKLFEDRPTLEEQSLFLRYLTLESDSNLYPSLPMPFYLYKAVNGVYLPSSSDSYSYQKYVLDDAIPFFVYDGSLVEGDSFSTEGIVTNTFDFSNDDIPIYQPNTTADLTGVTIISPNMATYGLKFGNYTTNCMTVKETANNKHALNYTTITDSGIYNSTLTYFNTNDSINNYIIKSYLVFGDYYSRGCVITNKFKLDGTLEQQYIWNNSNCLKLEMQANKETTNPTVYDTTISVEENPAPVIQNSTATDNVITLPSTVEGSIGLTSTDVNVGTTDVPGTDIPGENTNISTGVSDIISAIEQALNPSKDATTSEYAPANPRLLDLLLIIWDVLLASIRLIARFLVFIATLSLIPADPGFIPEDVFLGLNYAKSLSWGSLNIWDLVVWFVTIMFVINVVKIIKNHYDR